jgi:hypothetical protein
MLLSALEGSSFFERPSIDRVEDERQNHTARPQ